MRADRRKRTSKPSREDVASREPNILEACTMEFGYPGISPSEIKRRRLKRQAQDFAGGDPFCNEREDGLLSKRRKIESFPIGPPKDVCVLNHRGLHRKVVPTQHQKKTADSSPGTAKAKRNIEGKKSKQLITADESTTIGRLELFALHTDYTQTSTTRAAPRKNKKNRKNVPKKTRRDTASHLIFGKGIAGVGVWLGKSGTTTNPASDLGRQFSGDSLLDGILGTPQQTLPKKSVAIRRHPRVLPSRSPGSLPKTPIDGDFPQTPTIVTLCDDTASNGTVEVRTPSCDFNAPTTPTPQPQPGKRAREEEDSEEPGTPTMPTTPPTPRKRTKKTPTPPPSPTVVTRGMRRQMESRGVYLSLAALPY